MSRTGDCTSIVGGQNRSIYFPVQLGVLGQGASTMTWTHGVGRHAYSVMLHEVSAALPHVLGSGVDVTRDSAFFFRLSQPDANTIIVSTTATSDVPMFIMEAKFNENSSELDLVGVSRSGATLNQENDPRVIIS